jgi:hypothetical protein
MLLLALVAAACQSAPKDQESRVEVQTSPEYEHVRPVTIAVLPVKAPRADLRLGVREEVYRLLPERKYSPFTLREIDAHLDARGQFSAQDLDWDATFEIVVDRWTPLVGSNMWNGTGRAVLTHKTGEVLWACDFENYSFRVPSEAGAIDHEEGAKELAYFLVGGSAATSRLPDCPPPPGP